MIKIKLYGLYSEDQECLMGVSTSTAPFEEDYIVEWELSKYYWEDILWVTENRSRAEYICNSNGDIPYCNTSYDNPLYNKTRYGKLIVVELN